MTWSPSSMTGACIEIYRINSYFPEYTDHTKSTLALPSGWTFFNSAGAARGLLSHTLTE